MKMRLEHRAGSKILTANLTVSSKVQVFLAMRRILLPLPPTHTHTASRTLTHPEGNGQRSKLRRETGEVGI